MNKIKQSVNDIIQLLNQIELQVNDSTSDNTINLNENHHNQDIIASLIDALTEEGTLHQRPHWAAHMTAPISTASLTGLILSNLHNGNLLSAPLYPVLATIEKDIIDWLCGLFYKHHGHFVAGGSYANLEALWQAKKASSSRIVYCSTAAHFSIAKACDILDLELHLIDTDKNDKIDISALEQACKTQAPLAIIATLGTSTAGAIDPIKECAALAHNYQAWCHVDAAWGGMLAIIPKYNDVFSQLSLVDSVSFDPHKGWRQPKPSSVLLYNKPLSKIKNIDYLEQDPDNKLPGSYGGESFLPLWCHLVTMGKAAFTNEIQQCLFEATTFHYQLKQVTDWTVYPPDTGIVCFSPPDNIDLTSLVDIGTLTQATIHNTPVYRAVFNSPETQSQVLLNMLAIYF